MIQSENGFAITPCTHLCLDLQTDCLTFDGNLIIKPRDKQKTSNRPDIFMSPLAEMLEVGLEGFKA